MKTTKTITKCIAASLLTIAMSTAYTNASAGTLEGACLLSAKLGEMFADSINNGVMSEAEWEDKIRTTKTTPALMRKNMEVLRYVVTMQYDKTNARKMTYTACVKGAFD